MMKKGEPGSMIIDSGINNDKFFCFIIIIITIILNGL